MDFLFENNKVFLYALAKKYEEKGQDSRFAKLLPYYKAKVPEKYVESFFDGEIYPKKVREIDPTTLQIQGTFSLFESKFKNLHDKISKIIDKGYSFTFFGRNGSGKTHTAAYSLAIAIEQGKSGYFISMSDLYFLYNKVKSSREGTEPEVQLYDFILKCDFLVIDELGKESSTENAIYFVEEMLKTRQANGRSTVVTTNLSPDGEISNKYGLSVWDVLRMFFTYGFSQEGDFRKRTRPEWDL